MRERNKQLAAGFGRDAEAYHRARPGYPASIPGLLSVPVTPSWRVLEIGCGTGQATNLFLPCARELIAIDRSEAMLEVAARQLASNPNLDLIAEPFETVALDGSFDLIFSAQAFHWVEQPVGLDKAHRLLASTGRLALFWNYFTLDATPALVKARDAILHRVPEFENWPDASDEQFQSFSEEWATALSEHRGFTDVASDMLGWTLPYTRGELLDWITTLSWFRALDERTANAVLADLESIFAASPAFEMPGRTLLLRAQKSPAR